MSTVRDRIEEAVSLLADVSDSPRADAEWLMAHYLGISRSRIPTRLDERVDAADFRLLIERRLAYEPVQYIVGSWEFYSLPMKVRAPVLVPRPETEHLVEIAIALASQLGPSPRILDLCTGSGCVAIAIAANIPGASIVATDIGDDAIRLSEENARENGLLNRITLRKGDLFAALHDADAPFHVICSNPPYVEETEYGRLSPSIRLYEDPAALLAGSDGLDVIRRIVSGAREYLVPGGGLALEVGEGQAPLVQEMLRASDYRDIGSQFDLAGIERIVHARK
ncbi:MAG TPA: peptide chain release factor N(5)-glutamine methyltransferase [Candidatus Hydrogenedentes bacterium]|nr:peptide chain release factor N(5)-glutamine methyltransferase [Candidatus Hydrogenedentota bacterium]